LFNVQLRQLNCCPHLVAYELHYVPRLGQFSGNAMNNLNPVVTQTDVTRLGNWFHNLHLPGGVETAPDHPLGDFPARKWQAIEGCLPKDMTGWRVLDVGCNAGFYSFALAERGARVLGVDVDPRYLAQARWAASQFCFKHVPQFRQMSVYRLGDLAFDFDLVWFMGVAYHLRHPLLALDLLRCCLAPRYMMFQTMTFPDEPESPSRRTCRSASGGTWRGPAGRNSRSSKSALPGTRRTGGPRMTPAWRRCCAARDSTC
jgi:2-polyprenyl-3-methyl-5-hydroxy-6-metoxy-1,4-benzoquinol methylase